MLKKNTIKLIIKNNFKILNLLIIFTIFSSCTIPQVGVSTWRLKQFRNGKITIFDINKDKTPDLIIGGYQKGDNIDSKKLIYIESDYKTFESSDGSWEERGYRFYLDKKNKLWVKTKDDTWKVKGNYFKSNIKVFVTENGNIDVTYNDKRQLVKKNKWQINGLKVWLDEYGSLNVQEGDEKKIYGNNNWKRNFSVIINPAGEWIRGTGLKRGGKVDDKNIPIGDSIAAVDGKSKKIIWSFQAKDEITSYPIIYKGKVFVASKDQHLYALDLKTGEVSWKFNSFAPIYTTPAVSNGLIYFGNRSGKLFALNPNNGALFWQFQAKGAIDSSPAIYDEKIYFGSWDKNFYCLNAMSGKKVWKRTFPSYISSNPAIFDGMVFFGAWDRNIYSLDAENGKINWFFETNDWIYKASPSIAHGNVYIGNKKGILYAINAYSGFLKWQYPTGDAITSTPILTRNRVYVTSRDGYLYAISPKKGKLIWEKNTRYKIFSSPAIGINEVYLPTSGGYIFNIRDTGMGIPSWSMSKGEPTGKSFFDSAYFFSRKLFKPKTEFEVFLEENGIISKK